MPGGSDPNQPPYGTPGQNPPGADRPGTDQPGGHQPGTNQPGGYQAPGGYQPGTSQPGGHQPQGGYRGGPPTPTGPELGEADQRQWAMLAHLGGVLAIVPVLALLPSVLIYAIYGSRGEFVRDQSREALNFQITVLIAYVVASILASLPGFPSLVLLVWAFSLVFSIIGAMAANRGQRYRYPLTFRFIS